MVDPANVPRILSDAARLVGRGEIVVFGSAALAFWLPDPPATRDVDLWCEPLERGEAVEALMGELSWYQQRHGAYVEVWGSETFCAPSDWRTRARRLTNDDHPEVALVVPHPHDLLMAKLERWEDGDRAHAGRILAAFPLTRATLDARLSLSPYRDGRVSDGLRIAAFDAHFASMRASLPPGP